MWFIRKSRHQYRNYIPQEEVVESVVKRRKTVSSPIHILFADKGIRQYRNYLPREPENVVRKRKIVSSPEAIFFVAKSRYKYRNYRPKEEIVENVVKRRKINFLPVIPQQFYGKVTRRNIPSFISIPPQNQYRKSSFFPVDIETRIIQSKLPPQADLVSTEKLIKRRFIGNTFNPLLFRVQQQNRYNRLYIEVEPTPIPTPTTETPVVMYKSIYSALFHKLINPE